MRKILKSKVYHDGKSMIVLNAGDSHDVPERFVQTWIDEGVIAGKTSKQEAKDRQEQIEADEAEHAAAFKMKSIPGGRFTITGPDSFKQTVVGKDAAQARLAELNAPAGDDTGDDAAPVA